MKYILLLAMFYQYSNAQISRRIISEGAPDIILQTTILQTGSTTDADIDGYFSVQIPDKSNSYDLLIEAGLMGFKIENIRKVMHSIKMDSIELPTLKNISVDEYNKLAEIERARYIAIYHWANLVGCYDKYTLSRNYFSFHCKGKEHQSGQFTFDPENRVIRMDAKDLITTCD